MMLVELKDDANAAQKNYTQVLVNLNMNCNAN